MRTLADWLALQEAAHPRSIDLGLERISSVLRALGLSKPRFRVVTVGGTNGKGSTVAFVEALLRAGGQRVGAFTSPHLVRYNERVRVDGCEAGDRELVAAFERIEAARGPVSLTFFEYNTLAALLIFDAAGVDVAVLEVGMGGRLDATNAVDADVAVICSIGLDHCEWLGGTLELIGAEKAGILRPGRPAVLGSAQMPESVFAAIGRLGARSLTAGRDFWWRASPTEAVWTFHGSPADASELPLPTLPGTIQLRNAATALAAVEALGLPSRLEPAAIAAALRDAALPGRFQIVPGDIEWILDVAHNEPAARILAANLRARPCEGRTFGVVGILGDKDAAGIAAATAAVVDEWIPVGLPSPRGGTGEALAARMQLSPGTYEAAGSVQDGCRLAAERARPEDRVVVFGSFLTVGPALEWLRLY